MYQESNQVELKSDLIEDIKNEIVAFLNTKGGTIFVGVNDDGSICESFQKQSHDQMMLIVSSWVQEVFYPQPSNFIHFEYNQDEVLEIKVLEGSKKPYFLKSKGPKPSGVFKRIGTSIRHCSEEEILRYIMESNHYDYESDISENQELTFRYVDEYCQKTNFPFSHKEKITFGLINSNNQYTNLGLILSDQSPIEVKVAEYDEHMNFKLKRTFSGSLLKVLNDTQEQASRLNDVSAVIDSDTWRRIETLSYPGESLREIILNAFCHCNYFLRSNIKVEFYSDKAKITSPGGLYNTTLEEVLRGVQTYRNERLVHFLDKLGLIENFGTGIPRTLDAYLGSGKDPSFVDSENFFIVYLPNLNYKEEIHFKTNVVVNTSTIQENISDLGLSILKYIKNNPGVKVAQIFDSLSEEYSNLTLDRIRNVIKRELQNHMELRGSKKTGGYFLRN